MPSKRQLLADRRSQVGASATPVNITTAHLERVGGGDSGSEDVVAYWVPLSDLRESPFQYRYATDDGAVEALAQSIAAQDLYQPITVRPAAKPGQYEVVLGHRRLAAFRRLGRAAIPAIIREYDDQQALRAMLDENLRREDVNLFEQTEGVVRLIAAHSGRPGEPLTVTRQLLGEMRSQSRAGGSGSLQEPHQELAQLIQDVTGMPWLSFYANRMRVYSLPEALQAAVRGGMPYSLALAVQRLPAGQHGDALTFLGAPDGPWHSRQDLAEWAARITARPVSYSERLQSLGRQLDRQALSPQAQAQVEHLLETIQQMLPKGAG